jgi:hypothetical protein
MLQVAPPCGLPKALLALQEMADVNDTWVNLGSADSESSPSGASIIHSNELPANVAPGGGARVIEKCCPVASLAK